MRSCSGAMNQSVLFYTGHKPVMLAVKWLLIVLSMWWLYTRRADAADATIRLYTGVDRPKLLVPNHGFVRHDQIDDYYPKNPRRMFLACITPFWNCCSRSFSASRKEVGWWFFPNGTEIPKVERPLNWSLYTSRHERIVFLYRRGGTDHHGIHRCSIPVSADKNETLYVGLYPNGDSANPMVTSMQFNLSEYDVTEMPKFTLTCTSEGGPATTVTWTRDGEALSGDNFTATRTLDDPVTAAYTLTLSVVGRQGGVYRCQVAMGGPGVSGYPVNSSMELEVKAANPPTGLIALQENETTIIISWTPPTAGDTVTGYQIFYQPNNSANVNSSATHYTITNIEPNTTYSITIITLSEHLSSELAGPITPLRIPPRETTFTVRSEGKDEDNPWRIIVGGVVAGAGIIMASVIIAALLFLTQSSKTKTSNASQKETGSDIEMTQCAAYTTVRDLQQPMADHNLYQLPLPARQCASNNITSMQSNAFGCDGTVHVYESILCEVS